MNPKLRSLDSHLDFSPERLGTVNEERGDRTLLNQRRYHGRWNVNMMVVCRWCSKRDDPEATDKKQSAKGFFFFTSVKADELNLHCWIVTTLISKLFNMYPVMFSLSDHIHGTRSAFWVFCLFFLPKMSSFNINRLYKVLWAQAITTAYLFGIRTVTGKI